MPEMLFEDFQRTAVHRIGFVMSALAIQDGGERSEVAGDCGMIAALCCFAKGNALARERLRLLEMPARMLEATQVVIKRGHRVVFGMGAPLHNAQSAKVSPRALFELPSMLANHAERIEKMNPNHAVGLGSPLGELERFADQSIGAFVTPRAALAFAPSSQPENSNEEQRPANERQRPDHVVESAAEPGLVVIAGEFSENDVD
jgi:hypothetical protein